MHTFCYISGETLLLEILTFSNLSKFNNADILQDRIPSDYTRTTEIFVCLLSTEHKLIHAWNCSRLYNCSLVIFILINVYIL